MSSVLVTDHVALAVLGQHDAGVGQDEVRGADVLLESRSAARDEDRRGVRHAEEAGHRHARSRPRQHGSH